MDTRELQAKDGMADPMEDSTDYIESHERKAIALSARSEDPNDPMVRVRMSAVITPFRPSDAKITELAQQPKVLDFRHSLFLQFPGYSQHKQVRGRCRSPDGRVPPRAR